MGKFEDQLAALEGVVERLERGELPLDESVDLFEEGMRLSMACKKELDSAEGRIQVLVDEARGEVKVADLNLDLDDEVEDDDSGEEEDEP
jgi:exodeoxyribonuclease VII small subunit